MKVLIRQIEARRVMPLFKHHLIATILRTFLDFTELEYGTQVRDLRSLDRAEGFHWLLCNCIEVGIQLFGYGKILALWSFRFGKTILLHMDGMTVVVRDVSLVNWIWHNISFSIESYTHGLNLNPLQHLGQSPQWRVNHNMQCARGSFLLVFLVSPTLALSLRWHYLLQTRVGKPITKLCD